MLASIVAAVVILGLLIMVHEAGHFMMAKRCGVRVIRFSIGYPPRIWGIRRGETDYAIGATPLGGYVRMLGDEVGEEPGPGDSETLLRETELDLLAAAGALGFPRGSDPEQGLLAIARRLGPAAGQERALATFGRQLNALELLLLAEIERRGSVPEAVKALVEARPGALIETLRTRSFPTQSVSKRVLIVLAGPLANFVFAPVALALLLVYGVPRLVPVLGQVKQGLPAWSAGLHAGDRILAIDGHRVKTWDELSDIVKGSDGRALRIEFERQEKGGAKNESALLSPTRERGQAGLDKSGNWVIGVLPRGDTVMQRQGPVSAVSHAVLETGKMTVMLTSGIVEIIRGTTPIRQALGGPIMIAQLAGQQAHQGFANIAVFTVMLSIELAIINLFPVPLLDGGHLAFFLVECLRGKPVTVRHREMAQRVGLVVLAALMAFVIFNDISRIVQG